MNNFPPRWDRNYIFLVIEATIFGISAAFRDVNIVLPVFLQNLTSSTFLIGLIATLQLGGWFLPQLFVAPILEKRSKTLSFILKVYLWGRLPLLLLIASIFWGNSLDTGILIFLFFLVFGIFFLSEGVGGAGWYDLVARCIHQDQRGRFFATFMFLGGIIGFGAGFLVKEIIQQGVFPLSFGKLFLINFILLFISFIFLAMVKESDGRRLPEHESPREFLHSLPQIIREDKIFRRLLLVQILMGAGAMGMPFFSVYATGILGLSTDATGYFVAAYTLGQAFGGLIWGYLSDHIGNRAVVRGTIFFALMAPVTALLFHLTSGRFFNTLEVEMLYPIVFLFIGLSIGGSWIGFTNFTLKIAPEEKRPTYIGLMNSSNASVMLFPSIGGILLYYTSFPVLFISTAGVLGLSLILTINLPRS